ncbi:SPOR domain-containing protein [Sedimentitalea todarodis]|uniref:SPOR domain-containing protein n=1 Tax=Sedimentitalea todarodis TaxID=1631240 RepID=A0ABU3VCE0_9RHOB|nr:SPOR domain-containing protein [Sedimentitalea todarodis]MDU9003819.1 SPOR domain-containing protein [Sedimentitalea todarodis]
MAELYSTHDVGEQDSSGDQGGAPFGAALNVLGAAASLALIAGIGMWGYQLVMRDVSGVPVVRAVEGPMRVQPDNPGGLPADHQGLAVNAVAAQGTAEAPADRLILAPRPVDLADEDQPAKPGEEIMAEKPETTERAPDPGTVSSMVDRLLAGVLSGSDEQADTTVVKASARVEQPADVASAQAAIASDDANATPADVTGPGPARSLRPKPRPIRASGERAVVTPVALKPGLDVDPDSLPVGTRLAQLGAFESADLARQEWDRLASTFSDYMNGKSRVVQKANSGGRTFYRLRAMGFDDLAEARRFCSVLVAEKADCIPVVTR